MAKKSGPPLMMIGIVLVVIVVGIFVYKKIKAKQGGSALPPMPSMDAIVKNQTAATQRAHAARLTCGSCGG